MNRKLLAAMACYVMIAVLAALTLDGGLMRNAVWVLMGGLALKTYIADRAGWQSSDAARRDAEGEKSEDR